MLVHKRWKKAKKKESDRANKGNRAIEFEVGDPVYTRRQVSSKLHSKSGISQFGKLIEPVELNMMLP